MPNEPNPRNDKKGTEEHDAESHKEEVVIQSLQRSTDKSDSQNEANTSQGKPKPSFPLRFFLWAWQRRKWRRSRTEQSHGPHWAEITAMVFTGGILLTTIIQAFIYNRQAEIMNKSLQ